MANKQAAGKRPTHRIYAVTEGKDDKVFWTDIGAAWAHGDGKGFNLKLNMLPLNDAEIVLREPRAKDNEDQGGAA